MLPPQNRLTKKSDFEKVRQNGKFISSKIFSLSLFDRKDEREARFGFIVSKKISTKSHDRNRIKRILREIVRKNLSGVKSGIDYVIIVKSGIMHATNDTIEAQLKDLINV